MALTDSGGSHFNMTVSSISRITALGGMVSATVLAMLSSHQEVLRPQCPKFLKMRDNVLPVYIVNTLW